MMLLYNHDLQSWCFYITLIYSRDASITLLYSHDASITMIYSRDASITIIYSHDASITTISTVYITHSYNLVAMYMYVFIL